MKEGLVKLDICRFYTTTGYPEFRPVCIRKHQASKKCHECREGDCKDYQCSWSADRRIANGKSRE